MITIVPSVAVAATAAASTTSTSDGSELNVILSHGRNSVFNHDDPMDEGTEDYGEDEGGSVFSNLSVMKMRR